MGEYLNYLDWPDLIAPILAVCAVLVAIGGKTWDATQTGFNRVTVLGWIAVCLAAISFCGSLYSAAQTNREKVIATTQLEKIESQTENVQSTVDDIRYTVDDIRYGELLVRFERVADRVVKLTLANEGAEILIVSDLTLHWHYEVCPFLREATAGAMVIPHRYSIDITASDGQAIIDTNEFKYSAGDVDQFLVQVNIPITKGIYSVAVVFDVTQLNSGERREVGSAVITFDLCEKDP